MIRGGGGYAVVLTAKNHYVLSLSKTFYRLHNTYSTQEDKKLSRYDWKIVK